MDHPPVGEPCPFCRIAESATTVGLHAGHQVVWVSPKHVAFLDRNPNTDGAVVLITRYRFGSNIFLATPDVQLGMMQAATAVNYKLTRAFPGIDRSSLVFEGFGIGHLHGKIYPLHGTRDTRTGALIVVRSPCKDFYPGYRGFTSSNASNPAEAEELQRIADLIRAA